MAQTSGSVPLMADIEGAETEDRPSDLKNDFAYHNNVAGAAKQIRMGFLKKVNFYECTILGLTLFLLDLIKNNF